MRHDLFGRAIGVVMLTFALTQFAGCTSFNYTQTDSPIAMVLVPAMKSRPNVAFVQLGKGVDSLRHGIQFQL